MHDFESPSKLNTNSCLTNAVPLLRVTFVIVIDKRLFGSHNINKCLWAITLLLLFIFVICLFGLFVIVFLFFFVRHANITVVMTCCINTIHTVQTYSDRGVTRRQRCHTSTEVSHVGVTMLWMDTGI